MVHILPISHDVQFSSHPTLSSRLSTFLGRLIDRLDINLVCEEADDQLLMINTPLIQAVCRMKEVEHLPIDFNDYERGLIGIPSDLEGIVRRTNRELVREAEVTGVFPEKKFAEFRNEMAGYKPSP